MRFFLGESTHIQAATATHTGSVVEAYVDKVRDTVGRDVTPVTVQQMLDAKLRGRAATEVYATPSGSSVASMMAKVQARRLEKCRAPTI